MIRDEAKTECEAPGDQRSVPSILLVDDDDALRERLGRALAKRGYEVRLASCADQAVRLAEEDSPEMAVVDLRMPGMSGLELIGRLKEIDPATRILVLTGYGSIATAVDAMRLGASNYLPKPADADDILAAFDRAEQPPLQGGRTIDHDVPSLARAEWEHIHRVLAECGHNISEAARRLGVHRRSLQRKLRKLAPE